MDSNDDVCAFIDQYVSCAIPANDCKLKKLVLLLQQHKHNSCCKRNKRFKLFSDLPSPKTIIAEPCADVEVYDKAYKLLHD